jgi:hypothetical protein
VLKNLDIGCISNSKLCFLLHVFDHPSGKMEILKRRKKYFLDKSFTPNLSVQICLDGFWEQCHICNLIPFFPKNV